MSMMGELNSELRHHADKAARRAARAAETKVLLSSFDSPKEVEAALGRRLVDSSIMALGLTEKALRNAAAKLDGHPSHLVDEIALEVRELSLRLQRINHDDKGGES